MQITEHIHLAASGKWGFGLTHPLDCNVYLIDTGAGLALIDAGTGLGAAQMAAQLAARGLSLSTLRAVFLTHGHADHACGAWALQRETGCAVYAPMPECAAIAAADEQATGFHLARTGYPAGFAYPRGIAAEGLTQGDTVSVGAVTFTAHLVPGHSRCGLVLSCTVDGLRCLFTGDTVFAGGEILLQNLADVSIHDYGAAMMRLAREKIDALFPGHGLFCLSDGQWHLEQCARAFAAGLVPRQLHYFAGKAW